MIGLWLPLALGAVLSSYGQTVIQGHIWDGEQNAPIVGAEVVVKDVSPPLGAISGEEGKFQISVPQDRGTLTVSYPGYRTAQIDYRGASNLEVFLTPSQVTLDDVVVVGYGTQSKERVTSAISSVGEEAFERMPEVNFQTSLGGRIPGLVVTPANGQPGGALSLRVRGPSSISGDNQPLIVVDGMIMNNPSRFQAGGTDRSNPLVNINPNDIASVEVLKDAAASSIYGSQGANGVILVTTKRGNFMSKPRVNLDYRIGFSEPTRFYDLLDGEEYAQLWNQAALAVDPDATNLFTLGQQPSTDWIDVITRRGLLQSINVSVTGGDENTQYYLSGSYTEEQSYYREKGLTRYSFRTNLDQQVSDKVRVGLSIAPARTDNLRTPEWRSDAPLAALLAVPNTEAFDQEGNPAIIPNELGQPIDSIPTPLINLIDNEYRLTINQVLMNTYLSIQPIQALTFKTELSFDINQSTDFTYNPANTSIGRESNGNGASLNQEVINYNWTNLLQYQPNLRGGHDWDLTLGTNLIEQRFTSTYLRGNNFSSPDLRYLASASNPVEVSGSATSSTFTGYFLRTNYAYQGKYLATLSARVDGSSRFGANHRYGFFPAASMGWIISEEDFMQDAPFDFLKLRTSLGVSGNAAVDDFAAYSRVSPNFSYGGMPASLITQFDNDNLRWEKNQQWDAGLEFALWNRRLSGSLGYYVKDTRDLLLAVQIPQTSGRGYLLQNVGAMRNQGFEFDLTALLLNGPVSWEVSVNGATLQNEMLALLDQDGDGEDDDIIDWIYRYRVGEPAGSFFLKEYAGVNPENGDALYFDQEGNRVRFASDQDRRVVGQSLPSFTGGFTQLLAWRNFEFSAAFQFVMGHHIYRQEGYWLESNFGRGADNQTRSQLNAWRPDNTDTDVPEARLFQNNGGEHSTRYLDRGDYLRMRNLQVSYRFQIPGWSTQVRVYTSFQNLLTFTAFTGMDPEVKGGDPGFILGGISAFNSPQPRRYVAGLTLDF